MQNNDEILKSITDPARRTFFKSLGKLGLGAAATGLVSGNLTRLEAQTGAGSAAGTPDTANQIFTGLLILEDLLTTFYYNGLIGGVIQDPNLAGPGGTALLPSLPDNLANIVFLRSAFMQEIAHANLLRTMGNLGAAASTDPNQNFYFPPKTFASLQAFYPVLAMLEAGIVAAYLVAVGEFALLAAQTAASVVDGPAGGPYSAAQLQSFAQIAAAIMGVESEHRALAGVMVNQEQPNNLAYEQTSGMTSVTAAAALTPFLTASTGQAYSLTVALAEAKTLGVPSLGNAPNRSGATLSASPNPVPVTPGQDGVATISWNAPSASIIEIHVNSPGGPVLTRNINAGSMVTGAWITNGTSFYLQDASGGAPTLASNTLASIFVTLLPTS